MKSFLKWAIRISFLGVVGLVTLLWFILSHQDRGFTGTSDCGVVFGAAVWRDDRPSHALYDRVIAGVYLYEADQVKCLILSGGPSRYGAHEVDVMKKIVLQNDVLEQDLILDYEGVSTEKTLENIEDKNLSYVMISNDFHLARIRLLALKKGVKNVSVHASNYTYGRYTKEPWFILREVGGILYGGLFIW